MLHHLEKETLRLQHAVAETNEHYYKRIAHSAHSTYATIFIIADPCPRPLPDQLTSPTHPSSQLAAPLCPSASTRIPQITDPIHWSPKL